MYDHEDEEDFPRQGREIFFETVVVGADDRCYNKFLNSNRWFPCGQWKFSDPPRLIPIVGRVAWCGCVKWEDVCYY